MSKSSLDAGYFDGIFGSDDDPWQLASSAYEAAKFDCTIAALGGRRYARALEVGCAQGVLTVRLAPLCASLLAIDISAAALDKARARAGNQFGITFRQMTFPKEQPDGQDYDLVMLSEVVYYWDDADLARCADWLRHGVAASGEVVLVHWLGTTDYPQTGDEAVEKIWAHLSSGFRVEQANRTDDYRLDRWVRS